MNLTDVLLNDGKVISSREDISLETLEISGRSFPITQKSPLDFQIRNEGKNVLDIKCKGCLEVLAECDRCLDPVTVTVQIDFDEKADLSDPENPVLVSSDTANTSDGFDALERIDFIHGYQLDVDRLVCMEAMLGWPAQVLCKEDCKGLCSVCGANRNRVNCSCVREQADPRMAKILDVFQHFS